MNPTIPFPVIRTTEAHYSDPQTGEIIHSETRGKALISSADHLRVVSNGKKLKMEIIRDPVGGSFWKRPLLIDATRKIITFCDGYNDKIYVRQWGSYKCSEHMAIDQITWAQFSNKLETITITPGRIVISRGNTTQEWEIGGHAITRWDDHEVHHVIQ